jgi:hypothetical protein
MTTMRSARVRFLNQMVGRFYSQASAGAREELKAAPVNLLHTAVTTVVPNLVFNNPEVKIRTDILEYRQYSDVLELAVNRLIRQNDLKMTLRKCVIDSIFAAGFLKTGLATSDKVISVHGVDINIGQPFAERVDPDDMILDPNGREWDEQELIANRFTVNKIDAFAQGFNPDLIEKADSRFDNPRALREASAISGANKQPIQLYDKVDLVDVWIPREQRIYTMAWQPGRLATEFLNVSDHQGPERGPYHMLGYTFVPDNILPVPPASIWYDLHILANRIARKIARQAERMKTVLAYDGEATDDAENIRDAMDGEAVRVNNINGIKVIDYNSGPSEDAYAYMQWIKAQFSEQAGSLDQLAGTQSDAPTLGQSEILAANANVRLADLQNMVFDFTGNIADDMKFFLHTDPLIDLPLIRREKGIEEQVFYTPEMRKGEFLQYATTVTPHSMPRQDPNLRIRRLLEFSTVVIPAAAQAAQMFGPSFKVDKYISRIAKEIGLDEVDDFIDFEDFKEMFMANFLANMNQGKASDFRSGGGLGGGTGGGTQIGQPVPGQQGPTGGISPTAEGNSFQQDASAGAQSFGALG